MKNLFAGIFICLALFSCKKEPKVPLSSAGVEKQQKYGVRFKLKDFTPEVLGVKNKQMSEVPLKDKAEFLCYIAFNEEGKEVSRIRQFAAGGTVAYSYDEQGIAGEFNIGPFPFGTFSDSLANGNYTIVIIASQGEFGINSYNDEAAGLPVVPFADAAFIFKYVLMEDQSRTKDTFYKRFNLKVENEDLKQDVVLERLVAKAEINILDAKPELGYSFQFINEYLGYKFADSSYVAKANDSSDQSAAEITRENTKFTSFILNTSPSEPIDIIIEEYERPGTVIARKTIKQVPFFKNKVTVLTGNLHSGNTAAGFSVNVNDEFDKDTVNVSF
jgi:hypothetical protein